jgi:hypothetical protein
MSLNADMDVSSKVRTEAIVPQFVAGLRAVSIGQTFEQLKT